MKTIIFVLYHPSALTNWISKLAPYMVDTHIVVLHIAKLHGVLPTQIDGVEAYDISGYTYERLLNLVTTISPASMIFLSFRSLVELVLQRICTVNKIRQVYLQHGMFSQDTMKFRTNKLKKDSVSTIRRQLAFWKVALGCILGSPNPLKEISLFGKVYLKDKFSIMPHDYYYLFGKHDLEKMGKVYNLKENVNVEFVGYPIFMDEKQKKKAKVEIKETGGILYIHQPLIFDGIASITYGEEKDYLIRISKKLKKHFGKFTILLHPRSNLEEYRERYADTDIDVVQSPNNFLLFADKSLIVGHYSTALLYGLYFEKPVIVLDYPSMKNDSSMSEFFTYMKDIEALETLSIKPKPVDRSYFLGEVNTYEHIAKKILE